LEPALVALVEEASTWPGGRVAVEQWADRPILGSDGESLLAEVGFARGPRRMAYRAPLR
jgi:hypothetical protein